MIPNKHCCDTEGAVTAKFLYPNGTHVSADEGCTHGVYLIQGKQIIRLNYAFGFAGEGVFPPAGSYWGSIASSDFLCGLNRLWS